MPDAPALIQERLDRVLTQWRESPKFLFLLRTALGLIAEPVCAAAGLPDKFALDTAVGDQLTILGRRMGLARSHLVVNQSAIFGFPCGDEGDSLIAGFSERGTPWADCADEELGVLTVSDDDLFRRLLRARLYQINKRFQRPDILAAAQALFGDQRARLYQGDTHATLVISSGRPLTDTEDEVKALFPRVLPIPLGVRAEFLFHGHHIFGFGEGWGGFIDPDKGDALIDFTTESGESVVTHSGEVIEFSVSEGRSSYFACGEILDGT